jgi:hypothetical protein
MGSGMPIDYFVDSVFNYPTLAECYKVAAFDGLRRARPAMNSAANASETSAARDTSTAASQPTARAA